MMVAHFGSAGCTLINCVDGTLVQLCTVFDFFCLVGLKCEVDGCWFIGIDEDSPKQESEFSENFKILVSG